MPAFDALSLVRWLHFIVLSLAGGGAVVALLLSGFEDERPDLRGLAATVWKRTAGWGFRLALVVGIGGLLIKMQAGDHPFDHYYLHIKLVLVFVLLGASEMAPKALAAGKRGAAMLVLLLFLLASFTVYNAQLFGSKTRPLPMAAPDGTLHADR